MTERAAPRTEDTHADDDARTTRAIRKRFGAFERFVGASFAVVATIFTVSTVRGEMKQQEAREALLSRQAAAAADLGPHARAFSAKVAEHARTLANEPYKGDVASPRVRTLIEQPGVYLRITQPRVTTDDEIERAAKDSAKDAFATCLSLGVRPTDDGAAEPATACEPGTGCMGDRTGQLANLRVVHRGMHPFSDAWIADAKSADGLRLGVLTAELDQRLAGDTARAKQVVDAAKYVLLVVDEVPEGTPMPWFTKGLENVQSVPHDARVAVLDAYSGETIFRTRLKADAVPAASTSPGGVVGRQVQGCSLGLDVAERIRAVR